MRAILLLGTLLLSGCSTFTITESQIIRPDRVSGIKSTERFDQAALAKLLPLASLSEETVTQADGTASRGILVRQPGARATVLYFGGNAFHIDIHAKQVLPALAACKVNIALFDYRGYGRSGGEPTAALMSADALAIFDQLSVQYPGQLVVHGQSLGSFIAAGVTQQRAAKALVLESTTSNPKDWAQANIPWYLYPFVSLKLAPTMAAIDNVAAASRFKGPSLILAGERDRITPPALARKVFAAMPGTPKRMLLAAGAGHDDVLENTDTKLAYCAFLDTLKR